LTKKVKENALETYGIALTISELQRQVQVNNTEKQRQL
jgi:hypothetical protein